MWISPEEKKLKYLENSKYLLGIKYVAAQIKHSVGRVPISSSLADPTLLSALLIPGDWRYLCSPVVMLELYRSQVIHNLWAQIVLVGPGVMNQSCGYFSGFRMQSCNWQICHCQKPHITSLTHGLRAIIVENTKSKALLALSLWSSSSSNTTFLRWLQRLTPPSQTPG